jgi:hypothetical protein
MSHQLCHFLTSYSPAAAAWLRPQICQFFCYQGSYFCRRDYAHTSLNQNYFVMLPEYQPLARFLKRKYLFTCFRRLDLDFFHVYSIYLFISFLGLEASRIQMWRYYSRAKIPTSSSMTFVRSAMAASARFTTPATTSQARWWPSRRCPTGASSLWRNGRTFSKRSASFDDLNTQIASITKDATSRNTQFGYIHIT